MLTLQLVICRCVDRKDKEKFTWCLVEYLGN